MRLIDADAFIADARMIAYLALWVTIVVQCLTIRDLRKRIENEQKWSEYWRESWLQERNRQTERSE